MSLVESDICHCMCHREVGGMPLAMHIVACCETCDHCRQRIKISMVESHKERCVVDYHLCTMYEGNPVCVVCGKKLEVIGSFKGPYAFLSNFYPAKVMLDGVEYPNVECAYQAAKTTDPEIREKLRTSSPEWAKRNAPPKPPDWYSRSLPLMESLVRAKFTITLELRKLLLATHPLKLVEGNTWGDTFFGVCNGSGENHLGKTLMKVRGELLLLGPWKCTGCGARSGLQESAAWRWNGDRYEHRCPDNHPQHGHNYAVLDLE